MSQAKKAYTEIRRRIIDGTYGPGTPLRETQLAESTGTSRTPVREGLSRLLAEGLVDRYDGRGYFVAELTVKGLKDVIEVRKVIESATAALAAVKGTPDQKHELSELATFTYETGDEESYRRAQKNNTAFHRLIAEASRNVRFVELLDTCLTEMARYLAFGLYLPASYWEGANDEHHRIAEAIAAGEGDLAGSLMEAHIEDSNRFILEAMIDARGDESYPAGTARARGVVGEQAEAGEPELSSVTSEG